MKYNFGPAKIRTVVALQKRSKTGHVVKTDRRLYNRIQEINVKKGQNDDDQTAKYYNLETILLSITESKIYYYYKITKLSLTL